MKKEIKQTLGIIGFGAFGQLMARHLNMQFEVLAYDPRPEAGQNAESLGLSLRSLDRVVQSDVVVIAAPVSSFEAVVGAVAAGCRPGALIVDVGSVKVAPAGIMERLLPDSVDIVATHPLFGPQSARQGIRGLKIAVSPIRGRRDRELSAFLRKELGLKVIRTTPEDHDREVATVQGLTHLIAKVLVSMGPLPTRMTTRSFDLLAEAVAMVRNDPPEVFDAIERANPYTKEVRRRFFELAQELNTQLDETAATILDRADHTAER